MSRTAMGCIHRLEIGGNNMASKEEIQQVMKILWDLDAEDVDQALDSLVRDGLVREESESQPTHRQRRSSGFYERI